MHEHTGLKKRTQLHMYGGLLDPCLCEIGVLLRGKLQILQSSLGVSQDKSRINVKVRYRLTEEAAVALEGSRHIVRSARQCVVLDALLNCLIEECKSVRIVSGVQSIVS